MLLVEKQNEEARGGGVLLLFFNSSNCIAKYEKEKGSWKASTCRLAQTLHWETLQSFSQLVCLTVLRGGSHIRGEETEAFKAT